MSLPVSQSLPSLTKHVPKHRQAPSRLASRAAVRTLLVLSGVAVVGTGASVAGGALAISPADGTVAADVAATGVQPAASGARAEVGEADAAEARTAPSAVPSAVPSAAPSADAPAPSRAVPDLEAERPGVVSRSDRRGVADPRKAAALSLGRNNLMDRTEDSSDEDPRTIAQALLGDFSQFGCLDSLWTRESNWQVDADNPTSSAYGIPQSLPGSKMASFGADWATNPLTQIRWGLDYIEDRYGSPCGAWSHSQSNGWY